MYFMIRVGHRSTGYSDTVSHDLGAGAIRAKVAFKFSILPSHSRTNNLCKAALL